MDERRRGNVVEAMVERTPTGRETGIIQGAGVP
jgi:hypothetical protein